MKVKIRKFFGLGVLLTLLILVLVNYKNFDGYKKAFGGMVVKNIENYMENEENKKVFFIVQNKNSLALLTYLKIILLMSF